MGLSRFRRFNIMSERADIPESLEQDARFPSGAWEGYYLQPMLPGRHWMELKLTFREGNLRGEGRDRIGLFIFVGRYSIDDGQCWWTKTYIGKHNVFYRGYNEGKGIWGRWETSPLWHGGFHIWPAFMDDPTHPGLCEQLEQPAPGNRELVEVGA